MQLHLANWCARCVYVCMCVLERESGREGVWVDLSVVFFFRDEVQQTACQLDGMSAFCACARVCVFVGRLGVCVTCKVKGYCLVEHDEGLYMKVFRAWREGDRQRQGDRGRGKGRERKRVSSTPKKSLLIIYL